MNEIKYEMKSGVEEIVKIGVGDLKISPPKKSV